MVLTCEFRTPPAQATLADFAAPKESVVNFSNELDQLWIGGIDQISSCFAKDLSSHPLWGPHCNNNQDKRYKTY